MADLAAGAIAQQDPPGIPQGSQMAFSARQELSGWHAPSIAEEEEQTTTAAASMRPRLFVVFEDGSGYETLDNGLFLAYAERQVTLKLRSNCFCLPVSKWLEAGQENLELIQLPKCPLAFQPFDHACTPPSQPSWLAFD